MSDDLVIVEAAYIRLRTTTIKTSKILHTIILNTLKATYLHRTPSSEATGLFVAEMKHFKSDRLSDRVAPLEQTVPDRGRK